MLKPKLKHCDGPCQTDKVIWKNHDGKRYCRNCWQRVKPEGKQTSFTVRQPSPISRTSDKRAREERLYHTARKVFLDQHPVCGMNIAGICTIKATDVQHLKGRGKYYLDQTTWLQACRACHSYAELHPEEAKENGWAESRLSDDL